MKAEDVIISLPCDMYNNVFSLTHFILFGQITPRGIILLVTYLPHVKLFNYYEIFYDILNYS